MNELEVNKAKRDAFTAGDGWIRISRQADGQLDWQRVAPELVVVLVECRVCGCTDEAACFPTCWWVEPDLCSRCAANGRPMRA